MPSRASSPTWSTASPSKATSNARGAEIEIDPLNGTPITLMTGFYLIDDGPRRIMFPQTQIQRVDPIKGYSEDKILHLRSTGFLQHNPGAAIPTIMDIVDVKPFGSDWTRTLRFRGRGKDEQGRRVGSEAARGHADAVQHPDRHGHLI